MEFYKVVLLVCPLWYIGTMLYEISKELKRK